MPTEETFAVVASNIPCRVDFMFKFGSRLERVPEELVGRNHGMVFVRSSFEIKPRDVIVLTRTRGFPEGEQYEVEYVDPVLAFSNRHHWEVTVSKRDNLLDLPPVEPDDPEPEDPEPEDPEPEDP